MAEAELPKKTNYSSNSDKKKIPDDQNEPKASSMAQIASGRARKPTLGRKFREAFIGDDAQTVGHYIFFDVVIPATKNLLFDMLSEGARRVLFGSTSRGGAPITSLSGRTNYSRVYSGGASSVQSNPVREISQIGRANHDFREIVLETRGQAEEVLDALIAYIDEYRCVTVADYYAAVGITATHVDTKYGWYDLSTARVHHLREGYIIEFPSTKLLDS